MTPRSPLSTSIYSTPSSPLILLTSPPLPSLPTSLLTLSTPVLHFTPFPSLNHCLLSVNFSFFFLISLAPLLTFLLSLTQSDLLPESSFFSLPPSDVISLLFHLIYKAKNSPATSPADFISAGLSLSRFISSSVNLQSNLPP